MSGEIHVDRAGHGPFVFLLHFSAKVTLYGVYGVHGPSVFPICVTRPYCCTLAASNMRTIYNLLHMLLCMPVHGS